MNRIKTFLDSLGRTTRVLVLALAVTIAGAGITQAATTISTSITTAGDISATGSGTLTIAGLSTFTGGFVSVASSTAVAAFNVTGATTLASTTATTMKVGQLGTGMTRIVSGYCVTASTALPASSTASSTATFAECTPSGGASILSSTDRVFVQATSSLPSYIILQSASTTAGNLISTRLLNTSTSTSPAAAIYAFNFWAFQ